MPASPSTPRVQPDGRWPSTSSPATSTPWRAPELGPLHRLDVEVDREQVLHVEGVNGEARVYEVLVLLDPHAVVLFLVALARLEQVVDLFSRVLEQAQVVEAR